jgi:hypothetical protein
MTSMFKGPDTSGLTAAQANFAEKIAKPKPVRMPVDDDPAMLEAARRTRKSAMQRRGRASTIMTDATGDIVGSSGKSLGA